MGVLLAVLSSLMWGTSDFLGGTVSRRLPAFTVVLGSQVCALLVMAVVATLSGEWSAPRDYLPWGIAAGVLGIVGLVTFYAALASGTMGIVSPIATLGVLVPLGWGLLTGQVPAGGQILGILLALVGVVLASGPELSGASSARPVVLAGISAVVLGGAMAFIARGAQESVVMTALTMRVVTLVVAVVAVAATRSLGGMKPRDVPVLLVIGAFDVLANVTFGLSSTLTLLPIAAMIGSLYPVVTVLLAHFVHHERLARIQYAGVAVALAGVVLIAGFAAA